jgi:leucyl/phenylalanyl-tRNA--protein transferase
LNDTTYWLRDAICLASWLPGGGFSATARATADKPPMPADTLNVSEFERDVGCGASMTYLPPSRFFPSAERADPDGLLALGGRLTPEWLLDAYRHGIFPWPLDEDAPVAWWSPDPRAIIELDGLHVSRRLRRTLRSGKFQVTCDEDFAGVIGGCAGAPGRVGQTWITRAMIAAYTRMFELGHVHSVEAWHEGRLAGGVYGVSIGGLFAAESKFYRVRSWTFSSSRPTRPGSEPSKSPGRPTSPGSPRRSPCPLRLGKNSSGTRHYGSATVGPICLAPRPLV